MSGFTAIGLEQHACRKVRARQRTESPRAAGASSRIAEHYSSGRIATYRSTADPRRSSAIVMPSVIN